MSEQPTALRLARELEACPTINYKAHAAELRRLHAQIAACELYLKEGETPAQRKPLTDDQLDDIAVAARRGNLYDLRIAIERAHGIK